MKGFGLPQEDRQFQNKWRQKVHGQLSVHLESGS